MDYSMITEKILHVTSLAQTIQSAVKSCVSVLSVLHRSAPFHSCQAHVNTSSDINHACLTSIDSKTLPEVTGQRVPWWVVDPVDCDPTSCLKWQFCATND